VRALPLVGGFGEHMAEDHGVAGPNPAVPILLFFFCSVFLNYFILFLCMEIVVLRYGHRFVRDARVTRHCMLVARAFGAERMIVCGDEDTTLVSECEEINKVWGGCFNIEFSSSWKKTVEDFKKRMFKVVHLTMYGEPINSTNLKIFGKKILIVIGSQKVEKEVYLCADFNVSISSQPHSEIAALSVFMDRVFNGKGIDKNFNSACLKVVAQKCGKKVLDLKKD
jgi:tRNA (cytidine56-2'-O)-methyltransferase